MVKNSDCALTLLFLAIPFFLVADGCGVPPSPSVFGTFSFSSGKS